VLVTDGQVGNEVEILEFLHHQAKGIKVSTIGIDEAVNAAFLEQVASTTSGLCQLVMSDAQLDESMTQICRRIGNPALRNIQLEGAKLQDLVFQHNDLYPGIATRIYGRVGLPLPEKLQISAQKANGEKYLAEIEPLACADTVEKLWARERVLQMEHQFNVEIQSSRLAQQITDFSLRYGVLCRFTAFLAVDKEQRVPVQRQTIVSAVETPSGWAEPAACPAPSFLQAKERPNPIHRMLKSTYEPRDFYSEKSMKSSDFNGPRLPTSDALEKLAKERPKKIGEMLKSTWLSSDDSRSSSREVRSGPGGKAEEVQYSSSAGDLTRSTAQNSKKEASAPPNLTEILAQVELLLLLLKRNRRGESLKDPLTQLFHLLEPWERHAASDCQALIQGLSEDRIPDITPMETWLLKLRHKLGGQAPNSGGLLGKIFGIFKK